MASEWAEATEKSVNAECAESGRGPTARSAAPSAQGNATDWPGPLCGSPPLCDLRVKRSSPRPPLPLRGEIADAADEAAHALRDGLRAERAVRNPDRTAGGRADCPKNI